MEKYESDETLIARWVAGELDPEELAAFKASNAYAIFNRINTEAQKFKAPPIDKKQALMRTKAQITFRKTRPTLTRTWYAIAASIIILIGCFGVLNTSQHYQAPYGKQLAVTLPDGSKVALNAGASLSHKRFFWMSHKTVYLKGEGYFEVQKSDGFKVETVYGSVAVLGTAFNIKARGTTFELECYEGVVKFDPVHSNAAQILRKNDRLVLSNTNVVTEKTTKTQPDWKTGLSRFKAQPLQDVIDALERQYNISFQNKTTNLTQLFTGSFSHNNLETALKVTLTPLGISYTLSEDKTTVFLP
jgi:ferric-dicitrate binding protein FerR (iron transport regulator)